MTPVSVDSSMSPPVRELSLTSWLVIAPSLIDFDVTEFFSMPAAIAVPDRAMKIATRPRTLFLSQT